MSHLTEAELVDYVSGDAPDEDAVETHLFGCETCTREASRLMAVAQALRSEIPVALDRSRRAELSARGVRIYDHPVREGRTFDVEFPKDADVLLHGLGGLDLSDASRVDLRVFVESEGRTLVSVPSIPFDRDADAVYVACQKHFQHLPPDTGMEVRIHTPRGERTARFSIHHRFPA